MQMIKTDDVHLKGEIINWAKQQNYDQKETLEKWVEIRNKYKGIPESNEKDLQCYQELVTEMQSKNANIFAGRPAVPVEGYIIGASEPWLKNESNINNLMKQYNSGNIPVDKDNRPLIAVRDGVPIPIAYNRNGGTYDLKAKKEVKFAFYGAPENQTSMIIEVTVSGEVTNSLGVKEWFADHIGEIPLNKKVRMNVDVTEYGTYMHKTPIIEGQFFEVLEYESGKTIIDVFDEISGTNDFVEFEDIEDYAEDFPYILFLSEGTVINIGSPSSTGNVALSIGQSVKVLFGKVAPNQLWDGSRRT